MGRVLVPALNAKELYFRERDYLVDQGEVKIVDEFTGRVMEGRRWNGGLHQAVEAKEKVDVKARTSDCRFHYVPVTIFIVPYVVGHDRYRLLRSEGVVRHVPACVEINQCVVMLVRVVRNRHRHAIEQASRRWRGDRRDNSARTHRKNMISTQVQARRAALHSTAKPLLRADAGDLCSSPSSISSGTF